LGKGAALTILTKRAPFKWKDSLQDAPGKKLRLRHVREENDRLKQENEALRNALTAIKGNLHVIIRPIRIYPVTVYTITKGKAGNKYNVVGIKRSDCL
jgi:hypothetical protein